MDRSTGFMKGTRSKTWAPADVVERKDMGKIQVLT